MKRKYCEIQDDRISRESTTLLTSYNSTLANHPRKAVVFTVFCYLMLSSLELIPGTPSFIPPLLYFFSLGLLALYLMPRVFGLPYGRKSIHDYCRDIRLLPLTNLGRNVFIGLLMAMITLSAILLSSLLTGHFIADWTLVPPLRWIKGLTRGIWEEVFFRGIIFALFMGMLPEKKAVIASSLLFAVVHLRSFALPPEAIADLVSIFFMGLLFTYLVLRTGSLVSGIIFHYVHDIFVLFVQNTPGADATQSSVLLYSFLWIALLAGALAARSIVEHRPYPKTSGS